MLKRCQQSIMFKLSYRIEVRNVEFHARIEHWREVLLYMFNVKEAVAESHRLKLVKPDETIAGDLYR